MENQLSEEALKQYARDFTKQVCDRFFEKRTYIEGEDILNLTDFRQINLFIIKTLFEKWQSELDKFESPYFNFDAREVQEAFEEFANTLSQHIMVKPDDFYPLMESAVYDTLLLVFAPFDYYTREIQKQASRYLDLENLKQTGKYIKINRPLLDKFIAHFEKSGHKNITLDQAVNIFNDVFHNLQEEPEDIDEYLNKFSQELPLELNKIYSETEDKSTTKSDDASKNKADSHVQQKGFEGFERTTLNDQLTQTHYQPSLAEAHYKKKIDNIRGHISLNQKFMFTRELFGNSNDVFNQALNEIEECRGYSEAYDHLNEHYIKTHQWDLESEEAQQFLELLEKRFA